MNREELFRILDAMQPSVNDVKEYLNRLCGKTPLTLVFCDEQGGFIFMNSVIKDYPFVGILIEDTVFYAHAFTMENLSRNKKQQSQLQLKVKDIYHWIRVNSDVFPRTAYPLRQKEKNLMEKYQQQLEKTLEILDYHGLQMPKTDIAVLFDDEESTMCRFCEGDIKISHFIELHSDIWICSPR